ncbi:MAG: DUF554 domain-containing protein [Clostridia bacterium]|nr:DUF554 domain-containing protein [Clostridia bacterium]
MLGVLVNIATVIVGSLIGTLCRKGLPERLTSAIMTGLGLCVLYIGIDGALEGQNTLVLVLSVAIGVLVGTLLDIDGKIHRLGDWVAEKTRRGEQKNAGIGEGFVAGTLLFCVGAMTVVGSLNAGISGDNQTLITKALLDLMSSIVLSATLGIGVIFSSFSVLIIQGGLVLLAQLLQPFLTTYAINEMTCAGSVIIIGLGMNMLGLSKFKVADLMPAIVLAPLLCLIIK